MRTICLLFFLAIVLNGCSETGSQAKQQSTNEFPDSASFETLPVLIHVNGIVEEARPGYCGIYCQGGYAKVKLNKPPVNFNFRTAYLITACVTLKPGTHLNVMASKLTGLETECYYKSFDKPAGINGVVFYKIGEPHTWKKGE